MAVYAGSDRTALDHASSGLNAADHAAIHPDDPSRHIRRTRAHEKRGDGSEFGGVAVPPGGDRRPRLFFHLADVDSFALGAALVQFGDSIGGDAPGGNAVDG